MPDSVGLHQAQIATFRYNFADHGGAIGAIELDGAAINGNAAGGIPDDANILRVFIEPITDLTSGGSATVKLGITGNDDAFVAATAFDNTLFDGPNKWVALTNEVAGLKVNAANGVKVLATVATAALTGGSFDIHVEYLPGR